MTMPKSKYWKNPKLDCLVAFVEKPGCVLVYARLDRVPSARDDQVVVKTGRVQARVKTGPADQRALKETLLVRRSVRVTAEQRR